MITTLDGIKAKRGESVWEIGVSLKGVYIQTRSIVHSSTNPVSNEERCWKSYDLCQKECDKRNRTEEIDKSVCDVCGSDDIIEVPHMGKNCNRCHPL